ncbi:Membrane protein involved in the export of O-antigen and teichoic acid [Allochromatium warmingii]|uniref:Membrane protein involved in the export of O-antigen and teichoic acid n=1 Tax=Allochromatium warmingii TaxID=61595 RepID=A0A1H3IX34_ALLWA|nr:flippase [Allochromatium warmingii]SDY32280.1 Membrane protein involved in the export of O-antigen and teichoic acid [Allochromatium warmingii]
MTLIPAFIYRRIAHRPNLVRIVDNIGWLFFDKLLRMGVGLLVGVWVARYLGPEQFGLLNFALAFTGLFAAIATLGLPEIVVRDIVRDPENAQMTLGTAAVLQLIGGLVAYVLMLVAIVYLRPDDTLLRSIVAILGAMMLLKASEIAVYWFESQVQSKYTVWVQNSVFLVFAAVKVLLILQQASLISFVWVMFAEALVIAMILLVIMGQHGPTLCSLRVSIERSTALLRDSWPMILASIAVTVYMRIDQLMLGQMIGDEAVGIYSAAVRISEVWYFIPMAIVASVFPAILEAKQKSESQYYARLQKLYDLMVIISVSVALPMTFLATPIIVLLFGEAYISAGTVLAIYIWASIFVFLGIASGKWFLAEDHQMLLLRRSLIGSIANIGLNLWLIPLYGAVGAASATVISQAITTLFFDLLQAVTRPMFLMKLTAMNPLRILIFVRKI